MARGVRIRNVIMVNKYNAQQIEAVVTALNANQEKPYISHQWGELVLRLSRDNNPLLRNEMSRELEVLLEKDPGFKIFSKF